MKVYRYTIEAVYDDDTPSEVIATGTSIDTVAANALRSVADAICPKEQSAFEKAMGAALAKEFGDSAKPGTTNPFEDLFKGSRK